MNNPWTHEELQAAIPALKQKLQDELHQIEAEELANHNSIVRGIPPLTEDECLEYFHRLMDHASERPLTIEECMLHGQLLAVFQQAVMARMLGKKGRYFVVPEEKLHEMMDKK